MLQAKMRHFASPQPQAGQEQENSIISAANTPTSVAAFKELLDLSRFQVFGQFRQTLGRHCGNRVRQRRADSSPLEQKAEKAA
jgi:hypothetical protein